jgi:[acyl-carrier-protein] S-malonyltransferase
MQADRGEELKRTSHTQPAVFVHSMLLLEAMRRAGAPEPAMAGGHSLGEYTALTAAGVLSFDDALDIIHVRACAMDEAQPPGTCGMAAILGLPRPEASALVEASRGDDALELANYNAPDQVVASGSLAALERLAEAVKAKPRAKTVFLEVSSAFHTQLMVSAREAVRARLARAEFRPPSFPVFSNVTGERYPFPDGKELLVDQVVRPVLWEDCVKAMIREGVKTFIEIGPGKTLTGLVKRIDRSVTAVSVSNPDDAGRVAEALR